MPTVTECLYRNQKISVDRALELELELKRSDGGNRWSHLNFSCIECGEPVRPHRGGGHASAHFEHLDRNPDCSLSHRMRDTTNATKLRADYALDDIKAIEGYEIDRKITTLARNASIVAKCKKRDDYTCQACEFRLQLEGRFVIECHHIKPLAENGMRDVSLDELVCLCPTCHRIAHTRKEPFSVEEIKRLRERRS
ncbi:hypothetical protein FZZ93_00260 [Halomonas eurihalina]|uniref:HNH nuclease domain-containing protein n=1 Tax=Halomonas eurihalina TaxID=42566 RepID=A0A5D9DCY0_HALER|nr:HNH endonuclease [Halomonas eurihalina]MDR5858375.1 HNH endonuclease [Halomonas eurihalina]TZG41132.1 hypothetical protein FZZ93_00260 [Halomonas eurihalina]